MQYKVWKQNEHRKQQNEGKVRYENVLKYGVWQVEVKHSSESRAQIFFIILPALVQLYDATQILGLSGSVAISVKKNNNNTKLEVVVVVVFVFVW